MNTEPPPPPAPGRSPALLSVVVPCCNEEAVLPETHRRLVAALERVPGLDFELLYVDDGSRDGTLTLLRELQGADARVRVVALSRNFGNQAALTAGVQHAAGDVVVLMDADLQHPPEVIPEMLDLWRRGAEVAYGVRDRRDGEARFRRWTAYAFYRLFDRLSEVRVPVDAGDFRLMDRAVVDAFLAMPERDRFARGMVAWTGFRQEAVSFRGAARAAGKSQWRFRALLALATDAIVSFSVAPLRLATWFGLLSAGLALAGVVQAVAVRFSTGAGVSGWTALLITVLFIGGAQLVFLGVLGEYVGRIYGEVKRRPLYVIKERLGFAPDDPPAVRDELRESSAAAGRPNAAPSTS